MGWEAFNFQTSRNMLALNFAFDITSLQSFPPHLSHRVLIIIASTFCKQRVDVHTQRGNVLRGGEAGDKKLQASDLLWLEHAVNQTVVRPLDAEGENEEAGGQEDEMKVIKNVRMAREPESCERRKGGDPGGELRTKP